MPIAFHPRVWLNPIVPPIWPIERAMFEAGVAKEDAQFQEIARSQFDSFNYAARYQNGTEVFFHTIRAGVLHSEEADKLHVLGREQKWLEFDIIDAAEETTKAEFWIVCSSVSHILYSRPNSRRSMNGARIGSFKKFDLHVEKYDEAYSNALVFIENEFYRKEVFYINHGKAVEFFEKGDFYDIKIGEEIFIVVGRIGDYGFLLVNSGQERSENIGFYFGQICEVDPIFLSEDLLEAIERLPEYFE